MQTDLRNQRERLKPPSRDVSDFFFDQRLYDYTNKNLDSHITEDMKKYMDSNPEAKEKVGAMLLAFEYFNTISEVKLEYDTDEFLNYELTLWKRFCTNLKWFLLLALILLIFVAAAMNFDEVLTYFGPYLF